MPLADKKIAYKAIEVMRLWPNFFQPFAQYVVALIGQEFFRGNWSRCKYRWWMFVVVGHFRHTLTRVMQPEC